MRLTEAQASRRQRSIGLAAGVCCWVILAVAQLLGAFDAFDLRLLDWRFRLRGEREASDAVALVVIDDETIRAFGGWPLPRDQYALLLDVLEQSGARAIGVDLHLPEDSNHDPDHNALLAFVSGSHPNIVHAVSFLAEGGDSATTDLAPADLQALRRHGALGSGSHLARAAAAMLPFDELLESARVLGHITVAVDRDGAIRRQPLVLGYGDRVYAALALQMAGVGAGHSGPPQVTTRRGGARVGWSDSTSWWLPLDREGATSLDFAGDRGSFPRTYSMIAVLRAFQAGELAKLRGDLAGRFVLIGLDSRQEATEDVGTTPFAAATPLVYLHANALDNLLRSRFLRRPPVVALIVGLLGLAIALGWLFAHLSITTAALAAAASVLAIGLLDQAALAVWAIDVPPMSALLLPPLLYAAVASGRFLFLESRSRERETDIREGRSVEQAFLPEALVGRELSRYRVVEKIGTGGMGVVYRGHDPRLERDVAIKVLPARALADERSRRRLRREALALSRLNHPHIAAIIDFDSQDGIDFIVMEFVAGTPLSTRLKRGALEEPELVRISAQVAGALAEAHAHAVIHRDLKPENIMLTELHGVKVLDFGIARMLTEQPLTRAQSLTEEGHLVGTLPYMAPEVLRGVKTDPRSDLYSLGTLMFEMATGRRPFPNDEPHELMYTILHQSPPEPRILNGRVSQALQAIILKLLAKEPGERYASATDLLDSLTGLALRAADSGQRTAAQREGHV